MATSCLRVRGVFLAAAALSVTAVAPPTSVGITPFGVYAWVQGQTNVTWQAPLGYSPSSYEVRVEPLNFTNSFSSADDLNDFTLLTGAPINTIDVDAVSGRLKFSYSSASWQNASTGRGQSPYAVRRVPDGAVVELGSMDCSDAPSDAVIWACGLVVYNAGINTPLFTWMVVTTATGS